MPVHLSWADAAEIVSENHRQLYSFLYKNCWCDNFFCRSAPDCHWSYCNVLFLYFSKAFGLTPEVWHTAVEVFEIILLNKVKEPRFAFVCWMGFSVFSKVHDHLCQPFFAAFSLLNFIM